MLMESINFVRYVNLSLIVVIVAMLAISVNKVADSNNTLLKLYFILVSIVSFNFAEATVEQMIVGIPPGYRTVISFFTLLIIIILQAYYIAHWKAYEREPHDISKTGPYVNNPDDDDELHPHDE